MNTPKHTPGPWEVVGSRICTVANDIERITLAKTEPGGAFAMSEQQEANAALIAAAPAMYEALNAIVGQQRPNRWGYDAAEIALDDEWRAQARAALAQAEGRTL